jgi:phospholipid transport system transporter-binding protein
MTGVSFADNVLKVEGDLTLASVTAVLKQSKKFLSSNDLTIDLSDVKHSDSAGLALLCEWRREAGRLGATYRFLHAPSQLCKLATLSRVNTLLNLE